MNYEIIDKELGIASCRIGDLTIKNINEILQNWNDGSSISTMTLFYDHEQKLIVLNREHKNYKYYLDFTVNFLKNAINDKRILLIEFETPGFNEIAQVLGTVLKDRESAKIMQLINYQYEIRPYSEDNENDKDNIRNADSQNIVRLPEDMYTLGYIHGKRAERARKKRADKV